MPTISASDARQTLPAQLDRVEQGEEVSITRHGRIVAVLVRPDLLHVRRASAASQEADRVGRLLEQARTQPLEPVAFATGRADELAADARAERERE